MSIYKWTPVAPEKAEDLTLGQGLLYYNLGESGEAIIGAVRGGSELRLNRTIVERKHDGALGPIKGTREVTIFKPQLLINFLGINYTNLAYGNPITVSDGSDADGTYKKMIFRAQIESTDICTNIGFKGYKMNGDIVKILLLNALNVDPISFGHKNKDDVVVPMVYTGFYSYSSLSTVPFQQWDYSVA